MYSCAIGIGLPILRQESSFSPASLFASGEQGVWYDPSDFSGMYQEEIGLTPVTATGQQVGLILDKSKSLALSSELIPNGDFSSGANWTPGAGWSIAGGVAVASAVNSTNLTSSFTTVVGKWYRLKFSISGYTGGTVRPNIGQPTTFNVSGNGNYTYTLFASSATAVNFFAFSAFTANIDNVSLTEIAGNHASQNTSTMRPLLQQDGTGRYYLDFDGVDDGLITGTIYFTATDKLTAFAGIRKNAEVAQAIVAEFTSAFATNNGAFTLQAPNGAPSPYYLFGTRGTTNPASAAGTANSAYAAPHLAVFTGQGDIAGASQILRINGVQASTSASSQGTGNFASALLNIGKRNGGTLPFTGHIYALIVRGAASSAGQITAGEAWVNGKTGAF